MHLLHQKSRNRHGNGQIYVLFALFLPVLLVSVGLALDFGFAYVTKTTLSKAVDSAALAGMRNLNLGQNTATKIAQAAFDTNYASTPASNASAPSVNIAFSTNASNNAVVNVTATATINTYFLGVLSSGYRTLNVTSTAQATRPKLIMSLVLDRSGSMNFNGGAQALPPAVIGQGAQPGFISYFDDNTDEVADVSFSTLATTDVTIRTNFTAPITNAVQRMAYTGATFSQAAMLSGQTQINSVPVAAGQNVVKVAVFFTDGWANTVENTLSCSAKPLEFGGCAPPEAAVGWCSGISFMSPVTGNSVGCSSTTFPSQSTGSTMPITQNNVANDAIYRTIQVAIAMQNQGIIIYSIGLGDKISQAFLQQVANDPANQATFNPNLPAGEAVFAPNAADLQAAFQTIAAEILLRLSQ